MTHLDTISCVGNSGRTSIFTGTSTSATPHVLRQLAVAASLCLAVTASAGCLDEALLSDEASPSDDAHDTVAQPVTTSLFPSAMWANPVWFVGNSGSARGYAQVRFEYTNSGGVHDFTVPIDSSGGFTQYMQSGGPYHGDVIRATWSGGGVGEAGCDFVFRYQGGAVYSFTEMGCVVTARVANVVLNEILANEPGSATAGEFIELVNLGNGTAQLGGWTVADGISIRHSFAPGTTLAPGRAIVVFGGASAIPAGLGNAVAASTGALGLNNTGDTITLSTPSGDARAVVTYGSALAASDGVSMTLSPEGTAGGQYVLHSTLSAAPSSPGVRSSGAAW